MPVFLCRASVRQYQPQQLQRSSCTLMWTVLGYSGRFDCAQDTKMFSQREISTNDHCYAKSDSSTEGQGEERYMTNIPVNQIQPILSRNTQPFAFRHPIRIEDALSWWPCRVDHELQSPWERVERRARRKRKQQSENGSVMGLLLTQRISIVWIEKKYHSRTWVDEIVASEFTAASEKISQFPKSAENATSCSLMKCIRIGPYASSTRHCDGRIYPFIRVVPFQGR
jgi:hypothetical protein